METRKARGDIIQSFKILNGTDNVSWHTESAFKPSSRQIRSHTHGRTLQRELSQAKSKIQFEQHNDHMKK